MLKYIKSAKILVLALLTGFMTVSFDLDQSNAQSLEDARILLGKADNGDSDALDEAFAILEKLKIEQPENAKVLAYLGSAYGLRVGETWNPLKKGEYGNQSLRYIDIALDMAPNDFDVRKNRALVNMNAPFFMGRKDEGIEDLLTLDKLFRESPTPDLARDMLRFNFYDSLIEEVPDRGNWAEGKALAEKLAQ